jgi:hypothetical protein
MLKSYIIDAFTPELHKSLFEAAGYLNYRPASQRNWEYIPVLASSALNFMNKYHTQLSAGGTLMPASFPPAFEAAANTLSNTYSQFMRHRQSRAFTEQKIKINNEVYAICRRICRDGALIYKRHYGKRVKFTFTHIKKLISNPHNPDNNQS